MARIEPEHFDVSYGLASAAITSTGLIVIATTEADYHGIAFVTIGTTVTATVYDHASDTSGNILDVIFIAANSGFNKEKFIPVKAKNGITVKVVGSAGIGTLFYGPKG